MTLTQQFVEAIRKTSNETEKRYQDVYVLGFLEAFIDLQMRAYGNEVLRETIEYHIKRLTENNKKA